MFRNELLISIWRLPNFKLAQKYSFHALEVLPVARSFQPMYPLLDGNADFGHSNKVLMNGQIQVACRDWYFRPSKECFQFRKTKRNHMGQGLGEYGG